VLVFFAVIYMRTPSWYILAWPLAMLIQAVFLVGIGLTLAPLAVLYTDVRRLLRVVLRVLFYMSPVIYGVVDVQESPQVPDFVASIYLLNPLAGVFDLYRATFFPEFFAGWTEVAIAAAVSLVFLAMGTVTFSRLEGRVLKEI
jgi:ABC-2 type transport system permease protein